MKFQNVRTVVRVGSAKSHSKGPLQYVVPTESEREVSYVIFSGKTTRLSLIMPFVKIKT